MKKTWIIPICILVSGLVVVAIWLLGGGYKLLMALDDKEEISKFVPGLVVKSEVETFNGYWIGSTPKSIILLTVGGIREYRTKEDTVYSFFDRCGSKTRRLELDYGWLDPQAEVLPRDTFVKSLALAQMIQVRQSSKTGYLISIYVVNLDEETKDACI